MVSYMKDISITSRCAVQYRSEQLEGTDLNGFQSTYILYICKNPGISQDRLARIIYINKSNVTRQLAVLEETGFIQRKTCESDKRVTQVYPTQKALDLLPRVRQVFQEWNEYITSDLSEDEKAVFLNLLERIAQKAKQYADRRKDSL